MEYTDNELLARKTVLTLKSAKFDKSVKKGYLSCGLSLEPMYRIFVTCWLYQFVRITCPWAGDCAKHCLRYVGRYFGPSSNKARLQRTQLLCRFPKVFYALLVAELKKHCATAKNAGLQATCRLNTLSDLPWELMFPELFKSFRHLQFVDYTKDPDRLDSPIPDNYFLCYSINENTAPGVVGEWMSAGYNCSMVFEGELPDSIEIDGTEYSVIDGDADDLVHLTPGVIRGLKYKKPKTAKGEPPVKIRKRKTTLKFIN